MSFIQNIQGIRVMPQGSLRDKKVDGSFFFAKDPKKWPKGYAFGGWIYDINVTLGYSKSPTEMTLSIVLENDKAINPAPVFDISDELLSNSLITEERKGSKSYATYNFDYEKKSGRFYKIIAHGITFNRMYLFDYQINIEPNQKTLSVTLKDYSIILDKIYVGLIKRQGPSRNPPSALSDDEEDSKNACFEAGRNLRSASAEAWIETYCPNCYLEGEQINGLNTARRNENPDLKDFKGYGSTLNSFFSKMKGVIRRSCSLGSLIGRPPWDSQGFRFRDNLIQPQDTPEFKAEKLCFEESQWSFDGSASGGGAWGTLGYTPDYYPGWPTQADGNIRTNKGRALNPLDEGCGMHVDESKRKWNEDADNGRGAWEYPLPTYGYDPRFNEFVDPRDTINKKKFTEKMWSTRYSPRQYWAELDTRLGQKKAEKGTIGLTIDGGYILLGTEEFEEKPCGAVPNISYNFTELLNSLRNRGIRIYNLDESSGSFTGFVQVEIEPDEFGVVEVDENGNPVMVDSDEKIPNPAWPDKNRRFRTNYIGTLREVLEQWCGVYGLDFYYKDRDGEEGGFHFLDLQQGANVGYLKDIVDPTTDLGKEFGDGVERSSVIVSYKESSTLENTYIQKVITSNVKPAMSKERKKSIKRYVPILPLHPLDFASPEWRMVQYYTQLGEKFEYHSLANFIPWDNQPQTNYAAPFHGQHPEAHTFSHRKRIKSRTNREIWDIDVSIALARLGQSYRDMWISNQICNNAESEICPVEMYTDDHLPGYEGEIGKPIKFIMGPGGVPGAQATPLQIADAAAGRNTLTFTYRRHNKQVGMFPTATQEQDLNGNLAALGFDKIVEIEDHGVKADFIDIFLDGGKDIQDVSLDAGHYKMFLGYYDKEIHQQMFNWERACAEGMYGYGAIVGGTLPVAPFIPRDYYGTMNGFEGFDKDCENKGVSIPKLQNSFEPSAAQYPIYNVEQGRRPTVSLEAMSAPYNNMLIESGNYLPTGLYMCQLDNPWGNTVEHFEKRWWESFQDNACKEFNDSLNIVQEGAFNYEKTPQGTMKVNNDSFPFKKQDWNLDMFTPKFFQNTEKLLDGAYTMIDKLNDMGHIVDEASISRWSVDYGHQRFCKKLTLLIITDTRGVDLGPVGAGGRNAYRVKNPNIIFDASYVDLGKGYNRNNDMARHQRQLWEISEHKRQQKDNIRSKCDYDILFEFCEDAIQRDVFGQIDNRDKIPGYPYADEDHKLSRSSCAIDPTGVYKEGFPRELIGGYYLPDADGVVRAGQGKPYHMGRINSRALRLTVVRNPNDTAYVPTSDLGWYHVYDLEEELETLHERRFEYDIIYPINNFAITNEDNEVYSTDPTDSDGYLNRANGVVNTPFQTYSGIWTANVSVEDRRPELIEIYGEPPGKTQNPTAGIRVVNNTLDPDLGEFIDPGSSNQFITRMYDHEGNDVQTVGEYHNYVAHGHIDGEDGRGTLGLDDYSVILPNKKIDLSLAGSLSNFPKFKKYCDPKYGLQNLTISFSDQGVKTSLSFADRPPKPPQEEAILNKIGPRTM